MAGISTKLPLEYNKEDGPYAMTKTLPETIKQNFKNLLLTIPGERIMDPEFGVGVHQYLFENDSNRMSAEFQERLYEQVRAYLPFIEIISVDTSAVEHTLNIVIKYYISQLGISEELVLDIDK